LQRTSHSQPPPGQVDVQPVQPKGFAQTQTAGPKQHPERVPLAPNRVL